MFVGQNDDLGDVTDCRWAKGQIEAGGKALVHYEEFPGGHASFMVGKNMTYVSTLVDLLHKHEKGSPLVKSTAYEKFMGLF